MAAVTLNRGMSIMSNCSAANFPYSSHSSSSSTHFNSGINSAGKREAVTGREHEIISREFGKRVKNILSKTARVRLHDALRVYQEDGLLSGLFTILAEILDKPKKLTLLDDIKMFVRGDDVELYDQEVYIWKDHGSTPQGRLGKPVPANSSHARSFPALRTSTSKSIHTVVLRRRKKQNFGFSITGGAIPGTGIFVGTVEPLSIASRAGLREGDHVIACNGTRLQMCTQLEASQVLANAGRILKVIVRSTAAIAPKMKQVKRKSSKRSSTLDRHPSSLNGRDNALALKRRGSTISEGMIRGLADLTNNASNGMNQRWPKALSEHYVTSEGDTKRRKIRTEENNQDIGIATAVTTNSSSSGILRRSSTTRSRRKEGKEESKVLRRRSTRLSRKYSKKENKVQKQNSSFLFRRNTRSKKKMENIQRSSIVSVVEADTAFIRSVSLFRTDSDPTIGFTVSETKLRKSCVITAIDKDGLAHRVGLRVGEEIIEANGQSFFGMPYSKMVDVLLSNKHLILKVRSVAPRNGAQMMSWEESQPGSIDSQKTSDEKTRCMRTDLHGNTLHNRADAPKSQKSLTLPAAESSCTDGPIPKTFLQQNSTVQYENINSVSSKTNFTFASQTGPSGKISSDINPKKSLKNGASFDSILKQKQVESIRHKNGNSAPSPPVCVLQNGVSRAVSWKDVAQRSKPVVSKGRVSIKLSSKGGEISSSSSTDTGVQDGMQFGFFPPAPDIPLSAPPVDYKNACEDHVGSTQMPSLPPSSEQTFEQNVSKKVSFLPSSISATPVLPPETSSNTCNKSIQQPTLPGAPPLPSTPVALQNPPPPPSITAVHVAPPPPPTPAPSSAFLMGATSLEIPPRPDFLDSSAPKTPQHTEKKMGFDTIQRKMDNRLSKEIMSFKRSSLTQVQLREMMRKKLPEGNEIQDQLIAALSSKFARNKTPKKEDDGGKTDDEWDD
eukprot:UC4_evm2s1299